MKYTFYLIIFILCILSWNSIYKAKEEGYTKEAINSFRDFYTLLPTDNLEIISRYFCNKSNENQQKVIDLLEEVSREQIEKCKVLKPVSKQKSTFVTISAGGVIVGLQYNNKKWCIGSAYWK